MQKQLTHGFTLIELLVVIAVIGVLAGATIAIINPGAMIRRAQDSTVTGNFKNMSTEIEGIRVLRGLTMLQITGSGCSGCICRCVDNTSDASCITTITNSWKKLSSTPLPKDPWGNIYVFDENEQEGSLTNCTPDKLYSAGPDHILGSIGTPACTATNGPDDQVYSVSKLNCP